MPGKLKSPTGDRTFARRHTTNPHPQRGRWSCESGPRGCADGTALVSHDAHLDGCGRTHGVPGHEFAGLVAAVGAGVGGGLAVGRKSSG